MYTHKWKESIESEETSNRDEEKRTKNGIDRWKRQTYFRAFAFKHTHHTHPTFSYKISIKQVNGCMPRKTSDKNNRMEKRNPY